MTRRANEGLKWLGGRKKLSDQERKYMELIWSRKEGVMSEEIYEKFSVARGTVSAVLAHIVEKGYLNFERVGRNYLYHATVGRKEYDQALLKEKMEKYLGTGSFVALVGMFCGKSSISKEEQEEINALIKKLEETTIEEEE